MSVASGSFSQTADPNIIMTVGGHPVSLQEFKNMYYKNQSKDSLKYQKSLDNYINLFTLFKLKVNSALDARIDTTLSFKQEINDYRQKLAEPYMRDTAVENRLIREAYQRSLTDVKVSHILIQVGPEAAPADTLAAFTKITALRERIIKGEITFEQAAKENSDDTHSKPNGGSIGYITALGTVYPFENAAYTTREGEVSKPVRTKFGYHIIKVYGHRPNPGQVLISHIMIATPPGMSSADSAKAKNKIDSLYVLIKQGEDFASLAKKFSQDRTSAKAGGLLKWHGVGDMRGIPAFEETMFSLANVGDYSAPVKTPYGWHIIKLMGKKLPLPYDSVKEDLTARVMKDDRSELAIDALVSEIKSKNKFTEYPKAREDFYKLIDETFYKGHWTPSKADGYEKPLFAIGNTTITQHDFAKFLGKYQLTGQQDKGGEYAVKVEYPKFVKQQILQYRSDHLEQDYPQYSETLHEYREGILLFDITDNMVWTKALKDTTGLKDYFTSHRSDYMWGERCDASIYTCSDNKVSKEARKKIKNGEDDKEITTELNAITPNSISVQSNTYSKKDNALIDDNWKDGLSQETNKDGKIIFVNVRKIVPPENKSFSEVRGIVTTDYQNYLMNQWVADLRAKYPVTVNKGVEKMVLSAQ